MRPAIVLLAVCATGCRQDMHDQPKYQALAPSPFFADGRASRPLVENTVARGAIEDDPRHATGRVGGEYVADVPVTMTRELIARGRERYDIYCAVCHDRAGTGRGMIVRRGFRQPESFHAERLRGVADGYVFEVITHGFGMMPSYAAQIPIDDRWAIVAYVRALQLSQNATLADVPAAAREGLE
jgi:mono/diheme cytochrome c family protein